MSRMRPVIIRMNDGTEQWYPSMSDAARALDVNRETIRQIVENGRFGRRNYQGIECAWWSDYDRNKIARATVEKVIDNLFKDEWYCKNALFYLYEQYYIKITDEPYFEKEYDNRKELFAAWLQSDDHKEKLISVMQQAYGDTYNTAECVEDVEENIINIKNNLALIINFGSIEGDN